MSETAAENQPAARTPLRAAAWWPILVGLVVLQVLMGLPEIGHRLIPESWWGLFPALLLVGPSIGALAMVAVRLQARGLVRQPPWLVAISLYVAGILVTALYVAWVIAPDAMGIGSLWPWFWSTEVLCHTVDGVNCMRPN